MVAVKWWSDVTRGAARREHDTRPPPLRTSVSAAVNSSSRGRLMSPVSDDTQAVGTRWSGVAAGGGEGGGGGEGDPGGGGGCGEGEGGDSGGEGDSRLGEGGRGEGDGGGEGEGDMATSL